MTYLKKLLKKFVPQPMLQIHKFAKNEKKLWLFAIRRVIFKKHIILIKRKGNLGDVICTFPLVRHLKEKHSAIIIYECLPWNMEFPRLCPQVDLVVGKDSSLAVFCLKYLKPDKTYEPMMSDEFNPPKRAQSRHIVDEFAYSVGVEKIEEKRIHISFSNKALNSCLRFIERAGVGKSKFAVVHMGPTWNVREWQFSKWESLVELVKKQLGLQIIQVGAEFVSSSGGRPTPRISGCHDWVGKISIEETAALLSRARLFVGIDSGILHLAGGVGVPCVGIFGSTLWEMRLPREQIAIGLNSPVGCRGCHHAENGPLHWQTGCPNDIKCMAELAVDEVFSACKRVLKIADDHQQLSKN